MKILDIFKPRTSPKNLTKEQVIEQLRKAAKKTGGKTILADLTDWQLYRYIWSYTDYRNAVEAAEDITNPDRYELCEIYHDIIDDYAVFSAMQQRTSKAINTKIVFVDENGDEDEEIAKFFINPDGSQKAWFRRWLKIAQDVKYWGFEVAELGEFSDGEFRTFGIHKSVQKVPEQNCVPMWRAIKKNAMAGLYDENLISMDNSTFSPWLLPMGEETSLGLLNKAVPFVIWKYVFANWRQHAEIFGQPFREGRTDIFDNDRVEQMVKMFEEMTASAYGIFHPDDEVNFIETTKTDAYNIYEQLIVKCDEAITKIFLSQTGTTDQKSYVGAAETQERVLDHIATNDRQDISEAFNDVLLPKLKALGVIDQSVKVTLTWVIEQNLTLQDWASMITQLNQNYHIPADEVEARFNIVIEEKEEPTQTSEPIDKGAENVADILQQTQAYYQKLWRER